MPIGIKEDHSRFRQIIRGQIKQNLRKYISQGHLIGKKGGEKISIPIPQIDIPKFKHNEKELGGVGQGEGEPGEPIEGEEGEGGGGQAGSTPGEHILEVEISLEELTDILGEALELPKIEPKGKEKIEAIKYRYKGIRKVGPESLRHFKRTFKEALKRQISAGTYDINNPMVIPIREDKRYRSWETEIIPETNAVIIYMMDVSGSMGDEQKEIVRIESYWINLWIKKHYKGVETRYIIHDAVAREVDEYTFFHTRESGGTMISSAYKLCAEIIEKDYPPTEWNIYPFHFSDGDNWSRDDTKLCIEILKEKLLPACNLFCYGQVESPYGTGRFIKDLREAFPNDDKLITSEIKNREAIIDSIKDFLGKGK